PPWQPALPEDERIVIPGYASLREFSQAEEAAAKEGLGSRLWTLVHWGNWRVTFWVTPAHQDNVAREIVSELRAGRLVQLLVTNWPKPELNHTVVAFASTDSSTTIDFAVWDPNDPDAPGVVAFDRPARRSGRRDQEAQARAAGRLPRLSAPFRRSGRPARARPPRRLASARGRGPGHRARRRGGGREGAGGRPERASDGGRALRWARA